MVTKIPPRGPYLHPGIPKLANHDRRVHDDKAEKNGPCGMRAELAEVHQLAEEERATQTGGWADLAVPWIRRLLFIGIGLAIVQQLTGINSVMYYGTELLQEAGFSDNAAIILNILNGVFSISGLLVGLALMNRVDRRPMLLLACSAPLPRTCSSASPPISWPRAFSGPT